MDVSPIPVLELREVTCRAASGVAAQRYSFSFQAGTFNLLTASAGSEQVELLRVLGLLEPPASGEVLLEGRATASLTEAERATLRDQRCGFLFSAPFLLPTFTVIENVAMPLFRISQLDPTQARRRTEELLDFVGLAAEAQARVDKLTVTEQHRVSLARALANEPAIIFVESLALSLPPEEMPVFTALLRRGSASFGVTVVASAPPGFATDQTDRVIELAADAAQRDSPLDKKPLV